MPIHTDINIYSVCVCKHYTCMHMSIVHIHTYNTRNCFVTLSSGDTLFELSEVKLEQGRGE